MKIVVVGDAFIRSELFVRACEEYLQQYHPDIVTLHFGGQTEVDLDKRARNLELNGPDAEDPPAELFDHIPDTDILLGHYTPISRRIIKAGRNLKIIGIARAGYENMDLAAATDHGVLAFHVVGRTTGAVSDFAIGLILAECRNIARAHRAVFEGGWRKEFINTATTPELEGRTVGLLGFGEIARAVAEKLSGFGVRILAHDPFVPTEAFSRLGVEPVDLQRLLVESDFLSLHARLAPESEKIIGRNELALMKPTAYLINTARGGLIDTEALVDALRRGEIMGAALDVFDQEPLPEESELLSLDNVTLTSHLAYATVDCLEKSPRMLVEDICRLMQHGKPRFLLNPSALQEDRWKGILD